jgi:hypothetical protein
LGASTGLQLTTASNCTFLGYAADFSNTTQYAQSTAIGYNAKITANNQVMIATSTENVVMPGTAQVNNQYLHLASPTVLSTTTTLASGVLYEYYSVNTTAIFTITLPTITASTLGQSITFRRSGGTTTVVVSFIGNGTQNVYNTSNTGGTTAQGLMASGVYIVKLVSIVTTGTTYAWYQI